MPWYKAGTVCVVQNSNAVIGTNTAFIANARIGDAFRGPDGGWYEVTNIASDTALSITPVFKGATSAIGSYDLAPMQGYNKDTADALRAALASKNAAAASEGSAATSAGAALASKDAAALSASRASTLAAAALASKNAAAVSEANAAALASTAAALGVRREYIDGLTLGWNSATSINIGAGSAYVPSVSKVVAYAGGDIVPSGGPTALSTST